MPESPYHSPPAIDLNNVSILEMMQDAWQVHHRRNSKFPGDDGAVRKIAAGFHDKASRPEKQRGPSRVGRWNDKDIAIA